MQPELKMPPHSVQAEQSVLGGLMLDARRWPDIADKLRADDFYREDHRQLFEAIAGLADANKACDAVTVTEALRGSGHLEKVGAQYVGQLAMETPSAANIRAYAEIVREHSMARALIAASTGMAESAYAEDGRNIGDKLDEAEVALSGIRDIRTSTGPVSARDAVRETIEMMERQHESDSTITGLATGIPDLDAKTGGLQRGDLIYIAGRPSMGKTGLACGIAEHIALQGGRSLVFSMEMSRHQIMQRAISRHGAVLHGRVRDPKQMDDADWPKLTETTARLAESALMIDDTSGLSILDIRARARREARRGRLDCIVVDYIQLMTGDQRAKGNRNAELEPISRGLKALARELDVPVLALSQLSRQVEQREDKRPRMADMRDSGNLEQDADLILFVYRDEVYKEDSPHAGIAELLIGKHRNGPTGVVEAVFQGEYVRFLPYSGPPRSARQPQKQGNVRAMADYRALD